MTENERLTILYGRVLEVFGVPQDFKLLRLHGSKIFDRRTRLYRQATELRRAQLKQQYGLTGSSLNNASSVRTADGRIVRVEVAS